MTMSARVCRCARRPSFISTFEAQILPKHQTRFTGFGDKIVSMYARGMTTRSIEGHLKEIYGAEVTSGLVPVA
jgi:transposase-like protein